MFLDLNLVPFSSCLQVVKFHHDQPLLINTLVIDYIFLLYGPLSIYE